MRIAASLSLVVLASTLWAGLPGTAHAEDARSILETARQKQLQRWEGVNLYVVEQSLMGQSTRTYFQRTEVESDDAPAQTVFLPVQPAELAGAGCGGVRRLTADELEAYAAGLETTGDAVASGIEDGLEQAGLPRGLLAASGSSPTATFDPRVMMGGGAGFVRAAAAAERAEGGDADRPAAQSPGQMADFMHRATLVGTETVDGREAYQLHASGLDQVQQMDGGEYTLDSVGLWIDTEHYVPLKVKMDGVLVANGESRPMTIETYDSDYRSVPDSNLYEPYRRVMKMSGMLDPAQEAEMREAQKQLAQLEQQMAGMPANQRAMMENMIGPQLEMIRKMAAGGGFEMEITVDSITANPASVGGQACAGSGR